MNRDRVLMRSVDQQAMIFNVVRERNLQNDIADDGELKKKGLKSE